jgi:hypothetical protein
MILLDYGSRDASSAAVRQLVRHFPFCEYYYSDTRGWMWNRSAALNAGARFSDGDFLFFTDVDIFYPPWFVEHLMRHRGERVFFASACFRCPQDFSDWAHLARNGAEHKWPEMKGKGLMCCPRGGLEAVGGLDERFAYWGQEDHDFANRLGRLGLQELTPPDVYCYHQWHPHVIYEVPLSVQFNNLAQFYGTQTESRVQANERRPWGKLARFEDRPIYASVDPETGSLRQGRAMQTIEASGVANLLTTINEMARSKGVLWALPNYDASDRHAVFLNKVLRRAGWHLDRRLGFAGDVAQGLLLAVPGLFQDCYLDGWIGGRKHSFFLT